MKNFTIWRTGESDYSLADTASEVVRTAKAPEILSRWAFDNGADAVVHEYDLKLAEEDATREWLRAEKAKEAKKGGK